MLLKQKWFKIIQGILGPWQGMHWALGSPELSDEDHPTFTSSVCTVHCTDSTVHCTPAGGMCVCVGCIECTRLGTHRHTFCPVPHGKVVQRAVASLSTPGPAVAVIWSPHGQSPAWGTAVMTSHPATLTGRTTRHYRHFSGHCFPPDRVTGVRVSGRARRYARYAPIATYAFMTLHIAPSRDSTALRLT